MFLIGTNLPDLSSDARELRGAGSLLSACDTGEDYSRSPAAIAGTLDACPRRGMEGTVNTENARSTVAYADSVWANIVETRSSFTSYPLLMNNCPMVWWSNLQTSATPFLSEEAGRTAML